jgi:hypothetical protein
MPQHTPGPWTLAKRQGKRYVLTDPDSEPFVGHVIATTTTAPESEANLRLIAAAPKLLAALRTLVERYDAIRGVPGLSLVDGDFDAARAAIAESCGEVTA